MELCIPKMNHSLYRPLPQQTTFSTSAKKKNKLPKTTKNPKTQTNKKPNQTIQYKDLHTQRNIVKKASLVICSFTKGSFLPQQRKTQNPIPAINMINFSKNKNFFSPTNINPLHFCIKEQVVIPDNIQ